MSVSGVDRVENMTTIMEPDEVTQERYEQIKARTMFQMVEDVGNQRVLFFTNAQADLVASSELAGRDSRDEVVAGGRRDDDVNFTVEGLD